MVEASMPYAQMTPVESSDWEMCQPLQADVTNAFVQGSATTKTEFHIMAQSMTPPQGMTPEQMAEMVRLTAIHHGHTEENAYFMAREAYQAAQGQEDPGLSPIKEPDEIENS